MQLRTFRHHLEAGDAAMALPGLDSENTLVLVFGSTSCLENSSALTRLTSAYPLAKILGCSTAGEIFGTSVTDDSLSVAVARFDHTRLRLAGARVESAAESAAAGRAIAEALADPELRGVLVISEGLKVNGTELLGGLTAGLPTAVTVTGGLAGDGSRFQRTWTLRDGRPTSGWVSAVGFYGEHIRIGHGSQAGWDIFGPERLVTRSEGNVLYEVDRRPALDLYKTYLGDLAAELPASALLFPLSLRRSAGASDAVVRTILSVDETARSMTFAGDIPTGSYVQLMRANFDRLVDGAYEAARQLGERSTFKGESLAIAISCVGRRLVLGERTEDEIEAVKLSLPADCQLVGFYSYGEISPYGSGHCELHNQTMTLTHLSES